MKIIQKLNIKDFRKSYQYQYDKTFFGKLRIGLIVLLLIAACICFYLNKNIMGFVAIAIAVYFIFIRMVYINKMLAYLKKNKTIFESEMEVEINEKDIKISQNQQNNIISFDTIVAYAILSNAIYLYRKDKSFLILKRNAFHSEKNINELRQIIEKRRLKKI